MTEKGGEQAEIEDEPWLPTDRVIKTGWFF
jgi:hypothetical protein